MLRIRELPADKMVFYAVGFTVFNSCCYDFTPDPFIIFLKEVTGSNPAMGVLMQKMIEQNYIVEN